MITTWTTVVDDFPARGPIRSMGVMKERLSLSVDVSIARYLAHRAQRETKGNVSALVDRLVRAAQLAESVRAEARWYEANPRDADTAEAERYAA